MVVLYPCHACQLESLALRPCACLRARGVSKTRVGYSGLLTFGGFESKLRLRVKHWGFKAQGVGTLLLSITLESILTTSVAHTLRSPLRAIERVCTFSSDRVFANHPPSIVQKSPPKRTTLIYIYICYKYVYIYIYVYAYVCVYMYVCMYVCMHVCTYLCAYNYVCVFDNMYIRTYVYAWMRVCVCADICDGKKHSKILCRRRPLENLLNGWCVVSVIMVCNGLNMKLNPVGSSLLY